MTHRRMFVVLKGRSCATVSREDNVCGLRTKDVNKKKQRRRQGAWSMWDNGKNFILVHFEFTFTSLHIYIFNWKQINCQICTVCHLVIALLQHCTFISSRCVFFLSGSNVVNLDAPNTMKYSTLILTKYVEVLFISEGFHYSNSELVY